MEMDNVELKFEDDALRAIAHEAILRNTGARGLRSILERIMRDFMFEFPSNEERIACTITEEDVLMNQDPTFKIESKISRLKAKFKIKD